MRVFMFTLFTWKVTIIPSLARHLYFFADTGVLLNVISFRIYMATKDNGKQYELRVNWVDECIAQKGDWKNRDEAESRVLCL